MRHLQLLKKRSFQHTLFVFYQDEQGMTFVKSPHLDKFLRYKLTKHEAYEELKHMPYSLKGDCTFGKYRQPFHSRVYTVKGIHRLFNLVKKTQNTELFLLWFAYQIEHLVAKEQPSAQENLTDFEKQVIEAAEQLSADRHRFLGYATTEKVMEFLQVEDAKAVLYALQKGVRLGFLYESKPKRTRQRFFMKSGSHAYRAIEYEMIRNLPLFLQHFFKGYHIEYYNKQIYLNQHPCCKKPSEFYFYLLDGSLHGHCPFCKKEGNPLYFAEHIWERDMLDRFNAWREIHYIQHFRDPDIHYYKHDGVY